MVYFKYSTHYFYFKYIMSIWNKLFLLHFKILNLSRNNVRFSKNTYVKYIKWKSQTINYNLNFVSINKYYKSWKLIKK